MSDTVEASDRTTREFGAEAGQILQLMINNLYSQKEVFLRELISNASDACDRLRFSALEDESLYEDDGELWIRVSYDEEAGTITVADNGIGMSREEVDDNIGTIARSGAREFMEAMAEQETDTKLIGQFGVGFYSAFIVAERVELETRRAGGGPEEGVRWESSGDGEYTIETIRRENRGTTIRLHLREGEEDLLDGDRLRHIIETYSDHVSFPIQMPREGEDEEGEQKTGWETVNQASALWTRRSGDISDEEYREFYKHVAADFNDPLTWTHRHVEGRMKFTMLFYLPSSRPFDLYQREQSEREGVKLYIRRVFIMDDADMFLPRYLRFVRGVIDSDDLDLNVSRETLQKNRTVTAMKRTATNRVLEMLEDLADDPEDYATFWNEFGPILKEGIVEDHQRRDQIASLLRYPSTRADDPETLVSLDEYVDRMDDEQEAIYYVTAETFQGAKNSPHLEVFRDREVEVLLMHDRVDEWVVNNMDEYDGIPMKSVAIGDLDLDEQEDTEADSEESDDEELQTLLNQFEQVLGERVSDVRTTNRLTDSPTCLVAEEGGVSQNFERILREAGQQVPRQKPIMEVNPSHPLIQRIREEIEEGEADLTEWASILFEQAWLSEGGRLEDPAGFVRRMNQLMVDLLGEPASDIITEV